MLARRKKKKSLSRDAFDEVAYVEYYDDVRSALAEGKIESGWWHYNHYGRAEGRKVFFVEGYFDEEFYLRAYPIVKDELREGLASTPQEHYLQRGRARGFLPHYRGSRPDNGAALSSPFGGLWPDQANALDIVAGKREIDQITEEQAGLIESWIANGYVVLENALSDELVDAALADLDRAFAGDIPNARFECHPLVETSLINWRSELVEHPAKVIDIHHFSPAVRALMFASPITEFLGLIFESKAFASQTLGFVLGSSQAGHQDSAYVPFSIPRQFAASWIALEDVTIGGGELFYYPGSHRFGDFLYGGRYKSVVEAARCGHSAGQEEMDGHLKRLQKTAGRLGIEKKVLEAKKGDVLVWHADLVHGGNPVSADTTRKSLVTHYCPKRLSPLFAEHMGIDLYEHEGHLFTTQHYRKPEFVE